ncbi:MAG: DNA polymerase III subunit gamma/tau [Gammaproteobacteria bacterium]|nr:DNA polymerase III subunit gamma/tau [Gammaproteobacteria bacterium]
MSYQVLARKWRPRSFGTMVGQEHVLRALINALDNDRLHHAYLFTGTRGVGKTTVARIFAKSLNCEKGVSANPCGQCSACREIDEGRFIDLIEVDAASRTKVEDTRELLENVQYSPTRGRYKVYLIDEVHMLSTHSFNALLKTLEEPPPHVKFLLATTDPQKLPATILSRCLQFSLRRMSPELIAGHLEYVLAQEAVPAEAGAIRQIAAAADGSMRDALSLLDQAIGYGGGKLGENEVRVMLGTIDRSYVYRMLQCLADQDGNSLLQVVDNLAQQGVDFSTVLAELLSQLHRIALLQAVPQALDHATDHEIPANLAKAISPEDVQLYYQIGLNGRRDLPFAPEMRGGFEMIVLRMLLFRPLDLKVMPVAGARTAPAAKPAAVSASPSPVRPVPAAAPALKTAPVPTTVTMTGNESWPELIVKLGLQGMLLQLASNCVMTGREGNTFRLMLSPQHVSLRSKAQEQRLQEALQKLFGQDSRLVMTVGELAQETPALMQQRQASDRQQSAVNAIADDPNVQRIRETFNAQVVKESIQPID